MDAEQKLRLCDKNLASLLAESVTLVGAGAYDERETQKNLALFNALFGGTKSIALIGFMGAGKSTVSRYLKRALALAERETDAMIVEQEGMPITDIFEKYGEPYFRELESKTVLSLESMGQAVISCGGGLVMRKENVENLKLSSRIVLLTATPQTTLERVKNSTERPILNGNMNVEYIAQLMEKRRETYQKAADITIATDHKDVAAICAELVEKLAVE